jgi:hypothetical protein
MDRFLPTNVGGGERDASMLADAQVFAGASG